MSNVRHLRTRSPVVYVRRLHCGACPARFKEGETFYSVAGDLLCGKCFRLAGRASGPKGSRR